LVWKFSGKADGSREENVKSSLSFACVLSPVVQIVLGASAFCAEVRVAADHLNLRSAPSSQAEVVGQVERGTILITEQAQEDWLQVAPPDSVVLWVYGELIRDGQAAVSKVLVRAGPGINYRDVGRLEKGDKVALKGASASGEWLKIAPPSGCALWINRKYIEPVTSRPGNEPSAPAVMSSVSSPPSKPTPLPPASKPKASGSLETDVGTHSIETPPGLKAEMLVDLKSQGKVVQYEGVLGSAGLVWRKPSKYRLIKTDAKGHILAACYVLGDEAYLSSLKGKTILVYGREYWVQGSQYPVVTADQIVRRD
jgi:uncharacterized protein YraI